MKKEKGVEIVTDTSYTYQYFENMWVAQVE